jgi:hypothetical protein
MNIILDLDGTLINEKMEPRPYLKVFLHTLFSRFQNVSIWTFATIEWFYPVFERVLKPLMPEGKTFHFVRCRIGQYNTGIKPLTEVYGRFPNIYNAKNTLIVDNTPYTYSQNPQNAIPISTFTGNPFDKEFLRILNKLSFVGTPFISQYDKKEPRPFSFELYR